MSINMCPEGGSERIEVPKTAAGNALAKHVRLGSKPGENGKRVEWRHSEEEKTQNKHANADAGCLRVPR